MLNEEEEENKNFENILGNMLVARYQLYRLEEKLAQEINLQDRNGKQAKTSFVYKHHKNWYRVNVTTDKLKDFDKQETGEGEGEDKSQKIGYT